LYNPQEGAASFVEAFPLEKEKMSPLERIIKRAKEMNTIMSDDAQRAALIAEWLKNE